MYYSKIVNFISKNGIRIKKTSAVEFYNIYPHQDKKIEIHLPFDQNSEMYAFSEQKAPEPKSS